MNGTYIEIERERFEDLLRKETRLQVIEDCFINDGYMSAESVLRIINSDKSIKKADELRKKSAEGTRRIFANDSI